MSPSPDPGVVLLLSGPNLNLLGVREPDVYGTDTLADHVKRAEVVAGRHGLTLRHLQSNHEGELIDAVHGARDEAAELVAFMGRDKKAQRDLTFVLDGPDGVEPVHGVAASDVVATLADMGARR